MESLACLDGELMPVDRARVPVWDRGFLFGDAVYEVFRLYQGCCWLEDEHLARLRRSLAELDFPPIDLDALTVRIHRTVSASAIEEGTVYVHLTRGVAPRAHAFPDPPVPPDRTDRGPALRRRADGPPARLGRGRDQPSRPAVGAVRHQDDEPAGQRPGLPGRAPRGVLRGGPGRRATGWSPRRRTPRCSGSAAAGWRGRPRGRPSCRGRPGTSCSAWPQEVGIPFAEARVSLPELLAADEVLLSGTTTEFIAIVSVDGTPIADGRPGPVTKRLQDAFRAAVERWLAPQPA